MDMMQKPDTSLVLTVSDRHLAPDVRPSAMATATTTYGLRVITGETDTFIDVSAKGLDGVDMYCIRCKDPGLARCVYMAIRQGAQWLHVVHDPNGKRLLPGLPHYNDDGVVVITYQYCAQKFIVTGPIPSECDGTAMCAAFVQFTGSDHTDEWDMLLKNGYNRLLRRYYDVSSISPVSPPNQSLPSPLVTEVLTPSGDWKTLLPSPRIDLSI